MVNELVSVFMMFVLVKVCMVNESVSVPTGSAWVSVFMVNVLVSVFMVSVLVGVCRVNIFAED